jgi:catechol 2,3-dioxygenase
MRDLDAAKRFYGDILGMEIGSDRPGFGVFFRFGDYHHDIAVFQAPPDARLPDGTEVGLVHIALVADSIKTVQEMHRRLTEHGVAIDHMTDHGYTRSIYFHDPEGNQIEIYCEVPEYDYREHGMGKVNTPLDLEAAAAGH